MPNINDVLRKRKLLKKQRNMNQMSKVKRSFHDSQKHIEKEQLDKFKGDKLADKKMDFYNSLFGDTPNNQQEANEGNPKDKVEKIHKYIKKDKQNKSSQSSQNEQQAGQQQDRKHFKKIKFNRDDYKKQLDEKKKQKDAEIAAQIKEKEQKRKQIKKIFTERTKTGQPVMKNYINYLVDKLEKQKKSEKQSKQ